MRVQQVPKGKLSSTTSPRNMEWKLPILVPLSAVSRIVGLISHDLRHPLTAILANAEFLSRPDTTENDRVEFYREIRWAVDQMNDQISSLLEFSKGHDALRPAARNIVDAVERAVRMASARERFHRIRIEHRHTGEVIGWFDSSRIERVIANLVLNACEAVSPDSGHIVVTTAGGPARLQIRVRDNGPGVHPAVRASLFQPFVSCGKAEGSGLGLAIAKKIVEDHGGTICLDDGSDTGTSFRITIPFAVPDKEAHLPFAGATHSTRTWRNIAHTANSGL